MATVRSCSEDWREVSSAARAPDGEVGMGWPELAAAAAVAEAEAEEVISIAAANAPARKCIPAGVCANRRSTSA
jgi:hypothetical protein